MLTSDVFVQQVNTLPVAGIIRHQYQKLVAACPQQPVIVRSSGVKEDDYGDAQAGKYDSVVHQTGDIVKTCLQVLASSYQPALCPDGIPQPMAMVMQPYLDCWFGGVAISHQSLQDDTISIEYAPGQPKGAVADNAGIVPHRYHIDRKSGKAHWHQGHIPRWFALQKTPDGFAEREICAGAGVKKPHEKLPGSVLKQLRPRIIQLEDMLGCPVDVEFAIDQKGRLYLLQVRPVTALVGGACFSCLPPDESLCAGQLVSEGLSTGPLLCLEQQPIKPIPTGAIIQAEHAEDWMLKPAFLNRAGGFVFKHGGNNDHVAITLRQAGKPCLAGEFSTPAQEDALVTLVAGNFSGASGAYLLPGDQGKQWCEQLGTLNLDYTSALASVAAHDEQHVPTFTRPDQGFQWLQAQNNRLLNYFLPTRLLHQSLTPGQSKVLSMSGQRKDVLRALKSEVQHFVADAQSLLDGYQRFLQLADASEPAIKALMDELEPLWEKLAAIKIQAVNQEATITASVLENIPISFTQWLKNTQALKNSLQMMNLPDQPGQIRTMHDFIYFIHKRFTTALESVALHSGQGIVKKTGSVTTTRFSAEADSLLTEPLRQSLKAMLRTTQVLDLPSACIANIELGIHICTLEMFEQADGGKGRKLRLIFTETVSPDNIIECLTKQGRLKRMWFITHAVLGRASTAAGIKTALNPSAGTVTVEIPHILSTEAMQQKFLSMIRLMKFINDLDTAIYDVNITGQPQAALWDFDTLEKKIDQSAANPNDNDWPFKVCLLRHGIKNPKSSNSIPEEFNAQDRVFHRAGQMFGELLIDKEAERMGIERGLQLNPEKIGKLLTELTQNLPEDDINRAKRELSLILFGRFPAEFIAYIRQHYPTDVKDNRLLKSLPIGSLREMEKVLRKNNLDTLS